VFFDPKRLKKILASSLKLPTELPKSTISKSGRVNTVFCNHNFILSEELSKAICNSLPASKKGGAKIKSDTLNDIWQIKAIHNILLNANAQRNPKNSKIVEITDTNIYNILVNENVQRTLENSKVVKTTEKSSPDHIKIRPTLDWLFKNRLEIFPSSVIVGRLMEVREQTNNNLSTRNKQQINPRSRRPKSLSAIPQRIFSSGSQQSLASSLRSLRDVAVCEHTSVPALPQLPAASRTKRRLDPMLP
jgi:hypothetical protein